MLHIKRRASQPPRYASAMSLDDGSTHEWHPIAGGIPSGVFAGRLKDRGQGSGVGPPPPGDGKRKNRQARVRGSIGCDPLFRTRLAPGDFPASEPKKTETEWRIALEPKQIETARARNGPREGRGGIRRSQVLTESTPLWGRCCESIESGKKPFGFRGPKDDQMQGARTQQMTVMRPPD